MEPWGQLCCFWHRREAVCSAMLIAFAIILMMFLMLHMLNISWEFSWCQTKSLRSSALPFWSTAGWRYLHQTSVWYHIPICYIPMFICWFRDWSLSCFQTWSVTWRNSKNEFEEKKIKASIDKYHRKKKWNMAYE